ncbi:MAG TPA: glycosyltransferase [Candidatus Krumholzibacteria bacterium]|nr:glycosyltransferase [Candidatus Krumholzibacteria bacterium]
MRVCLVGPVHPYRGGISHFTAMLAREFARSHPVHVVSFSRLYPGFLFPGRTQFDESGSPCTVDSMRVIDSINPFSWRRAADAVVAFRPGVVVFQWWHPFFAPAFRAMCRRIRRRSDARIVFLCHNVLPHESNPLDRMLVRWGLGGADAFVVQSREDERTLLDLRPAAVVEFNPMPVFDLFAGDGPDREAGRRQLGVSGRVVLFFGLVRPYKGLGTLLDAFARCGDALDATLLVVGEFYEPRASYDARIKSLGIASRVRVIDRYVPNEEVGGYFRAADVVVLPYVTATQSAIAQTAFSFEKPVIVTAVGGLPDVVADGVTGFVVPPEDPDRLAAAITRFFTEDAGDRMAAAIRDRAGEFTWARCAAAALAAAETARAHPNQQAL